nr:MAG TPA: hypothetical protein [Caudoviricetes sp.]
MMLTLLTNQLKLKHCYLLNFHLQSESLNQLISSMHYHISI